MTEPVDRIVRHRAANLANNVATREVHGEAYQDAYPSLWIAIDAAVRLETREPVLRALWRTR